MVSLFNIPKQCVCSIPIKVERFFKDDNIKLFQSLKSICWYAALKPDLINASAVKNEIIRYEEIQIITLTLNNTDFIFDIARKIFKEIKYPCLLIMNYKNKYILSSCQFTTGKIEYNENILRNITFSHWIYPEQLSPGAETLIDDINNSINANTDLCDIYTKITHSLEFFRLSGLTQAHVRRLLSDMLGSVSVNRLKNIMKHCTPYKKYAYFDQSLATKYDKTKRKSNYIYSYDCEDIWYCLMNYEPTKKIVMGRRYRDINDLIYTIDTKLEEAEDRW